MNTAIHLATWKESIKVTYSPGLETPEGYLIMLRNAIQRESGNVTDRQIAIVGEPKAEEYQFESDDMVHIDWKGSVEGTYDMSMVGQPKDRHSFCIDRKVRASSGEQGYLLFMWTRWKAIAALRQEVDGSMNLLNRSLITGLRGMGKLKELVDGIERYQMVHQSLYMAIPNVG